jgi:hypothetical protein
MLLTAQDSSHSLQNENWRRLNVKRRKVTSSFRLQIEEHGERILATVSVCLSVDQMHYVALRSSASTLHEDPYKLFLGIHEIDTNIKNI